MLREIAMLVVQGILPGILWILGGVTLLAAGSHWLTYLLSASSTNKAHNDPRVFNLFMRCVVLSATSLICFTILYNL